MNLISVCIPSYNRARQLGQLLNSVISQSFKDYEILIVEDKSPERDKIRNIVKEFIKKNPTIDINYHENAKNLGYDKNLRKLFELSKGKYCLTLGNDDLLAPNALYEINRIIKSFPNVGVILRSYSVFKESPENIVQNHIYSKKELFFTPSSESISFAFRRSVVMSGMVYHRGAALETKTDIFDGTLLYQLHVVCQILKIKNLVSTPSIIALYRTGGVPDFGNADSEKKKFVPQQQTIESSLSFMRGMLKISKYEEKNIGIKIHNAILNDISNYSYPILSIQAKKPFLKFINYVIELIKMGLGKKFLFYFYFVGIVILGTRNMDKLISFLKKIFISTPFFKI